MVTIIIQRVSPTDVLVSVFDTGSGIKPSEIDNIFDYDPQVNQKGNLGLGLAWSRWFLRE